MPSFQDICDAPLAKIKSAIDDWRKMAGDLTELHASATKGMRAKAVNADWTGNNSDVTKPFIDRTAREFNDAALEAKGIADILNEGYMAFKGAKDSLKDIVETEAPRKNLTVDSTGKVTAKSPLEDNTAARRDTDQKVYEDALRKQNSDIADLQKRIKLIVEECTHMDEWTSRVLKSNATRDKHDFSKPKHTTIDAAEVARAAELAKIVSSEGGTARHLKELKELKELTHANKEDPEFSTAFYRKLGPEGSLEFYAKMSLDATSLGAVGQDRVTLVHGIQNDMGLMLGTATRTHGAGQLDAAWTTQLMRAGRQQIDVPGTGPGGKVYGYQALGSLIREGKYDTKFLTSIARDMTAMDKADPDIWEQGLPNNHDISLNLDKKGGKGFDPLIGLMEAMGNNPSASTAFFNEPVREDSNNDGIVTKSDTPVSGQHGKPQGTVDYFLDKNPSSDWYDLRSGEESEANPFQRSLGNALEAAVTHRAPGDSDAPQVKHTESMANVMERVVEKVGENPDLVAARPGDPRGPLSGLAGNFGDMSAEYMPDMQRSIQDGSHLHRTFGQAAEFDAAHLQSFLSAVAQDPGAYGAITNAQQTYTTAVVHSVVEDYRSYDEPAIAVQNAVNPGGVIAGIMSEARAEAEHDLGIHDEKEYNDGVADNGKWANRVIDMVGSKYIQMIPVGGDVVTWIQEDAIDAAAKRAEKDELPERQKDAAETYWAGKEATSNSAESAVRTACKGSDLTSKNINNLAGAASTEAGRSYTEGATGKLSSHG